MTACPSHPAVRQLHDPAAWNDLVLSLKGANLRHGHEWGELRRRQGWTPVHVAVMSQSQCEGAASALVRRLPGPLGSVVAVPGGFLLRNAENREAWQLLAAAIARLAKEHKAAFVRVSPRTTDSDVLLRERLAECGFKDLPELWTTWNDPRVIMTLDIRATEEVLKRGMREKFRQTLKKAVTHGVTIERTIGDDGIRRFHRLLAHAGATRGQPVRRLETFLAIRELYLTNDMGCLLLAQHRGRDLGGVLAVRFGAEASFLYSALDVASKEARRLKPGLALHWEMIRWARSVGCQTIDWGGTGTGHPPSERDPGYGIYMFKLGFGCTPKCLAPYADRVHRPFQYRLVRMAERRLLPMGWRLRARLNEWST